MPKKNETIRECCLTREKKPVSELIRFALGPDNKIVPDVDSRAPGRGIWVTLSQNAVETAVGKKVFARALRQQVTVPPKLAMITRRRLEERLLGALGLCRKAGQLITGAAKVEAAMSAGKIIALFTASDAAETGRQKMLAHLRAHDPQGRVGHFEFVSSCQLDLALGLENVIHAALVKGAAADAALARAKRLARYRDGYGKEDGTL